MHLTQESGTQDLYPTDYQQECHLETEAGNNVPSQTYNSCYLGNIAEQLTRELTTHNLCKTNYQQEYQPETQANIQSGYHASAPPAIDQEFSNYEENGQAENDVIVDEECAYQPPIQEINGLQRLEQLENQRRESPSRRARCYP